MIRRQIAPALLLIAVGLSCDGTPSGSTSKLTIPGQPRSGVIEAAAPSPEKVVAGQTIYVPIYSHVYTADNAQALNLSATLFVRNTDPSRPITLIRVSYFGSDGKLVRESLKAPLQIAPMASMDFFVKESDVTGGVSPSFVLTWVSTEEVNDPFAESVMIGTAGTQGISFACPGRILTPRKP